MSADGYQWDRFVADASDLFKDVTDKSSLDDDWFILQLGALAARWPEIPEAKIYFNDGLGPDIGTGPVHMPQKLPFFVLVWTLAPGAVLPAHDHPNYSFCTLGVKGEVRIRNYESTGSLPDYHSTQSFQVRKTKDQLLTPGKISTLTRHRDNIHQLDAGRDFAMGIDIGILHSKDEGFSYLNIPDQETGSLITSNWDSVLTRKVRG